MRKLLSVQVALLIVWLATPLFAHPAPFSYFDLHLRADGLEATLTAHTLDLAHELDVTPADALLEPSVAAAKQVQLANWLRTHLSLFADGRPLAFQLTNVEPLPDRQALALHLRFAVTTLPGLLKIHCALFPYDPQHQTFLNVYETDVLARQDVFDRDHPTLDHFTGTRQGTQAALKTAFINGVYHSFAGPEHILFLIGLLLLGASGRWLLSFVAAFVAGHSLTLALGALNIIHAPERVIEALLALTLIYAGLDNLLVGTTGRDARVWIAAAFGLLHGVSFVGEWREFGLPSQSLRWSFIAFDAGLAMGQLCLAFVSAALLAALRERVPAFNRRIVVVGSLVVILAGSYWFIRRVFIGG